MKIIAPKYNKQILFTVIIIIFVQKIQSQEAKKTDEVSFWSKVRFGGNVGVGFTNDTFNAIITPTAVYDFTNQFSAGVGLNFGYTSAPNFSSINYGANFLTLYKPIVQLEFSAEFEQMGVSRSIEINQTNGDENYWYPALFVGAAYRQGAISVGVRYDVLYDQNTSIYASAYAPFIRILY